MDIVAWYAGNLRYCYLDLDSISQKMYGGTGHRLCVLSDFSINFHSSWPIRQPSDIYPSGGFIATPDSRPPTINVLLNLLTQKPRRIVALHLTLNTNGQKNTGTSLQNICTKENTNTHKTTQNREIRHQQFPNIFW